MPHSTVAGADRKTHFDAVVVGAGFAGLAMLYRLRELGFSARVYEAGSDVGGTWYWNRYPGARTDSESYYYCFSFSKELCQEWTWSERYPAQPEVLRYLSHVADRFDLRRDIQFKTRIASAHFDETSGRWDIDTESGERVSAQFFITATGFLSATHVPQFKGQESFKGKIYHTGNWPHEGVDFSGKRVGIIGTGASGIQAVPLIAEQCEHLTVFQRTPNYAVPAQNRPLGAALQQEIKQNYDRIWEQARAHWFAMPIDNAGRTALSVSPDERQRIYEDGWNKGGFRFLFETFDDIVLNKEANDTAAEFIRAKIRQTVHDPEVAERLSPRDYPYCGKRPPAEHGYYEAFNRDNVSLVDVKSAPIVEITHKGIRTTQAEYELDGIVLATGFDAVTGPLDRIDIRGRDGLRLKEKWQAGPITNRGLGTYGFPNLYMISGPGSPFANLPVCIEKNVEWIGESIRYLRAQGFSRIEPTPEAEQSWAAHVRDVVNMTLLVEGEKVNSWFTGANIPGKAHVVNVYFGGADKYFESCDRVAADGYEGFTLSA